MPPALAAPIGSTATGGALFTSAQVGAALTTAITVSAPFLAVGGIWAIGYLLSQKKKRPKTPPLTEYQRIDAVRQTVQSSIVNQRVIVGEVSTGGVICYTDIEGAYYLKGYLLANHEIEDVLSMTINGETLFTDANGYVTSDLYKRRVYTGFNIANVGGSRGRIDNFIDKDYLRANFRLGTNDQEKDMIVDERIPTVTEHFRQVGNATAFLEYYRGARDNPDWFAWRERNGVLHETEAIWGSDSAEPPDPLFRVRGLKCYDPRSGKTEWTRNAACILGAVLTNPSLSGRNDIDYDNFDMDAFKYAADACDEGFEIEPNSDFPRGAVFKKYTLDGVISTDESLLSVLQSMFLGCRGSVPWFNNKYQLKVSGSRQPVMTLNDSDWEEEYSVQTKRRLSDTVNTIRAQYRNEQNDGQLTDAPPVSLPDIEIERPVNIVLPYTKNTYRAQHIMHQDLQEFQLERQITGVAGKKAMTLERGDLVYVQSDREPQNEGKYLVWSKEMSLDGTKSRLVLNEWDGEKIDTWTPGTEEVDIRVPLRPNRSGLETRS